MIDKVEGKRIGNDNHPYLIALLEAIKCGWVPPTIVSKEEYYDIKKNPSTYAAELVGFVGFLCSFGGKWWGGYAANNSGDNYAERGSRMLVKQASALKDVIFKCGNYLELEALDECLIYCDPPYAQTTKYKGGFNHEVFWEWCRVKSESNIVFISEYHAPDDFICVKEVEHKTILNKNSQDKRIEKLFRRR